MSDWRPYEGGYPPTSEGWYSGPPYLPSPAAPSPPNLPSYAPYAPPPAHAHTQWAVDSSRFQHYNLPPQPFYPSPLSATTSSSLHPSPRLPVIHPLPPPNPRSQGSFESASSTSTRDYEQENDGPRGPELPPLPNAPSSSSSSNKSFINKLYTMLENPQLYSDVIAWDPDGVTFVVAHTKRLESVLVSFFGHANIASFTRQLNVYQFRRLTTSQLRTRLGRQDVSDYSGWDGSPHFRKGDSSALHLLLPRQSKSRLAKKAAREERLAAQGKDKDELAAVKPGRTLGGSWSRAD